MQRIEFFWVASCDGSANMFVNGTGGPGKGKGNQNRSLNMLENIMTDTISVAALPVTIEVTFKAPIGMKVVDLRTKSAEWLVWAIANGLRQSIGDAAAGKSGAEATKALNGKFTRVCVNGEVPEGQGRGASLPEDDEAVLRVLNLGRGQKDQPARWKNSEYDAALLARARQAVAAAWQKAGKDAQFVKANAALLAEKATANKDAVKAAILASDEGQKQLVAVRADRAKKVEKEIQFSDLDLGL